MNSSKRKFKKQKCARCGKIRVLRGIQCCRKCKELNNEHTRLNRLSNPKGWIYSFAKRNARLTNRPFKLRSSSEIPDIPEFCPVFPWIKIRVACGEGHRDDSPSIDRMDSSIGYEVGNVRIISWRANLLKRNATAEELIYLGKDGQRLLMLKQAA